MRLPSLATLLWVIAATAAAPNALQDVSQLEGLADQAAGSPSCGYSACPRLQPNRTNIHIIAHSHQDLGRLATADQYFYGTRRREHQFAGQFVLDSLVPELLIDRSRRFLYAEVSFFARWWQEQNAAMRAAVRRLVGQGRLEFANGGWCANDEATTSYQSSLEQMSLGLRFLNHTFGSCGHPRAGWQIDSAGHSSEQAALFAQFGFDAVYFARAPEDDKHQRAQNRSLDLIWHGDRALSGQSGSIMANVFRDSYQSPAHFCFDVLCQDDQLVDNRHSAEYNIEAKAAEFVAFARKYAEAKLTRDVLVPVGGDFHFSAAGRNFKALDKLIKYIRGHVHDVDIFYSTPSCYQLALHQTVKHKSMKLPEKYNDFMPHESPGSVWWSGFFSSRPSVKLIERQVASLLPVARLVSLSHLLRRQHSWLDEAERHEASCLLPLWELSAELQHHDAVTGTSRQHVADELVRRADHASRVCARFVGDVRRAKLDDYIRRSARLEQLRDSGRAYKLDSVYLESTLLCPQLNISQCEPLESELDPSRYLNGSRPALATPPTRTLARSSVGSRNSRLLPSGLATRSVLLNVYNPLGQPLSQHDIRLPCNWRCDLDKVKVVHLSNNATMRLTRLPVSSGVGALPFREATSNFEVLFYANVPALGYTSFVVEDLNEEETVDEERDPDEAPVVADESTGARARSSLASHRRRRRRSAGRRYEHFALDLGGSAQRSRRDTGQQNHADQVIVKFDLSSGMIVGLKRARDGSVLNITQRFGWYFPAAHKLAPPAAYVFRPNSSEPVLLERPLSYKMHKRKGGALIEIHQKWADWIWQTIRVDAKRNYIEFDYVVGPIPTQGNVGRELVSRYITSLVTNGTFVTDSNGRQLVLRHRKRHREPEHLGGSFFPVVSTIALRDIGERTRNRSVEAVALLVDRAQAGTSLHDGQLELLLHRRHPGDGSSGAEEPLDELGEDGRGLVTRGSHRLFIKFQEEPTQPPATTTPAASSEDATTTPTLTPTTEESIGRQVEERPQLFELPATPRANLHYEKQFAYHKLNRSSHKHAPLTIKTFVVHDRIYNELRQESVRLALRPVLTFDRLRVGAAEFVEMVAAEGPKIKTDFSLLNVTLPANVHILTLQPWNSRNRSILLRLENLDNPLTLHPFPDVESYQNALHFYQSVSDFYEAGTSDDNCADTLRPSVELDVEYLIKRIRIVALEELWLGANVAVSEAKRLDWTDEVNMAETCQSNGRPTAIKLAPRQIRTFLVDFEYL